jgi:hypothetical protein
MSNAGFENHFLDGGFVEFVVVKWYNIDYGERKEGNSKRRMTMNHAFTGVQGGKNMDNKCIKESFARLTVALSVVVLGLALLAHGAEYSLIANEFDAGASVGAAGSSLPGNFPPSQRSRPVTLTPLIATPDGLAQGDTLTLNLFDDKVYTACIDRVSVNVNGTVTVRGRIEGYSLGYVLISTTGDRSLGSVLIPENGEHYIIQSEPHNVIHYLLDVNVDQLEELEDGQTPIPPSPTPQKAAKMEMLAGTLAGGPMDPANIDVMVVYTLAARQWANSSGGGMANIISQAMGKAQLALDNSNTILTMNLVYSAEVSYTESGSSNTDLDRLTSTSDGYMDGVHTWRNQYGADLVALFTYVEDTGGLGWLLNSTSGSPAYAFCITRVQQASWTYTHIHEMGHNMGCHHRKDQATQPGPGLFSYSAGWHWIGNDSGKYCSVMSYEDGGYSTVAYFSNPSILYKGVATGDAADGDNARTIREIKGVVAGYRNSPPKTPSLVGPANEATWVSITPTLRASSFSDSDGDSHANSHWQVSHNSGFTDIAWDSGESYQPSIQTTLPSEWLNYNTTYYWRVRYKDNRGTWSIWASPWSFTTCETPAKYSGGTGEPNDPYRIATAEDLNDIGNHKRDWSRQFILVNDINLAEFAGTQFNIIANGTTKFTGVFDGNDHRIWNVTWNSITRDGIGLFGYVGTGGQIKNLGMENVNVQAGNGWYVGGLAAQNEGTITNCYSTGSVSGWMYVGGLVGFNYGTIVSCCSTGSISGNYSAGGLLGGNSGTITSCYSTCSVTGEYFVGGLVGDHVGTITGCYSTGSVSGTGYQVGGLVGRSYKGTVGTSFWDTQTSGQSISAGGIPKTTGEMKIESTFTEAGWDFVNIWDICEGTNYPRFCWQIPSADWICPDGVGLEDFSHLADGWQMEFGISDLMLFCEQWLTGR